MPYLNTNIDPYRDDYDALNDYYQVLYRPGRPVQARELNQQQSMLQNQIATFAQRILKNGDNVVPGEYGIQRPAPYVRLASITNGALAEDFRGSTVTGVTSGVIAKVNYTTEKEEGKKGNDITFYITYESSGDTSEYKSFLPGETLLSDTDNLYTAEVQEKKAGFPKKKPVVGAGCLFTVEEGWFYIGSYMLRNAKQTVVVDPYGTNPTARVGFLVTETFVNASEDTQLLDNSTGSSNFNAPGADRLKITLNLVSQDLNATDPNFISLATIIQGNIQGMPGETIKWQWLYDLLAKRTYDESGDYIVTDFAIKQLEYPNTETQTKGLFDANNKGTYPPVPLSGSTDRLTFEEADANYVLEISPGTAYVQGYQVEYKTPVYKFGTKARTQLFRKNSRTGITPGYNLDVTNAYSTPNFENDDEAIAFSQITCYRNFGDGYVGEATKTEPTAENPFPEPYNYGNPPPTTYHITLSTDIGATVDNNYKIIWKNDRSAVVTKKSGGAPYPVRGQAFGGIPIIDSIKVNPIPTGVVSPRYFMPTREIVEDESGVNGFDSIQNLGIITSNFFTELAVVSEQGTELEWEVGYEVKGIKSRAVGTVEQGTDGNSLILSNISGEFRYNETISQTKSNGDEVLGRLLRPGDVYGFYWTTGDGGTNTNSTSDYDLGSVNSIVVTSLEAKKTLTKGADKDFIIGVGVGNQVDGSQIILTKKGRERLYNFPFPAGSPDASIRINYKAETDTGVKGFAVLLPSKITNSLSKTKSFFGNQTGKDQFSADIATQSSRNADVLNVAQGSTFNGKKNNTFIICEDFTGDPSNELLFGDVVTFTVTNASGDDYEVSKMVYFATAPIGRGTGQRARAKIYFTTALEDSVQGKVVARIRAKSKGEASQNLIFQLPQAVCSTLETNARATKIEYEIYREYIIDIDQNSNSFSIQTAGTTAGGGRSKEEFLDDPNEISIAVIKNIGDKSDADNLRGRTISIDQDYNDGGYIRGILLEENNTKATYRLAFTNGAPKQLKLKVLVPVQVRNASARLKVLRKSADRSRKDNKISAANAYAKIISLGKADGFRLNKVETASGMDITKRYNFDNGQRDNVYHIARLELKKGKAKPKEALYVDFEWFEHSGDGDFFSVDSYTHDDGISYSAIPVYNPIAGIVSQSFGSPNVFMQLRDCVDFRPVVNTQDEAGKSGIAPTPSVISAITDNYCCQGGTLDGTTFTQSDINFKDPERGGNAFSPRMPVSRTRFQANIAYYAARYDSLFLEKNGQLTIIQGEPGNQPEPAPDLQTGIRLYDLFLPAYTFTADDINVKKFNYKRFRMKDLAEMERRVDRVEELITLSILEQSTLNMSVRDAATGMDRFKNGIVVDNFRGHGNGAVGNQQYRNSIDPKQTHLRAPLFQDQVEFEELWQSNEEKEAAGYVVNNGIATLPFVSGAFINQPSATRTINLQPYSVFTWEGNMELDPPLDTWQDINEQPDLVVADNDLYDAMVNLTGSLKQSGIGTVWGDWETKGSPQTSVSTKVDRTPSTSTSLDRRDSSWGVDSRITGRLVTGGTTTKVETTTTTTKMARQQTKTFLKVDSGATQETSYGERVTNVALAQTMRTIPVRFRATRLKPNTRYYAFFDGVQVNGWIDPDELEKSEDFGDNVLRYPEEGDYGAGGKSGLVLDPSGKGFGANLMSDGFGTVQGTFLIPNGRKPEQGTQFRRLNKVKYQKTGITRSFTTGTKIFRLTSNKDNPEDMSLVEGIAEEAFTASGIMLDKQETVVSTRVPSFKVKTKKGKKETRTEVEEEVTDIEVDQGTTTLSGFDIEVDLDFDEIERELNQPNRDDPVAQTFRINAQNAEGVFVTELQVYFKTKDKTQPVLAYLTTTDGEVPTNTIIPHSKTTLQSDSILRTEVTLPNNVDSVTLNKGDEIEGLTSGATGVIAAAETFESATANETRNVDDNTYNIILKNYLNEFVPGEQFKVTSAAKGDITRTKFYIVDDEIKLTRLDMTNFGTGYSQDTTTVTISAPDLKSGRTAKAEALVSSTGEVYALEFTRTGKGYTKPPTVSIDGAGSNAKAAFRYVNSKPAIKMGVATSKDATAPTTFKFKAPIYLLADTFYSFVVKAPTSLDYLMYCAKMGENKIGTNVRVVNQPNLGALFMSQSGGLWTEDQTMDVMFKLRRARFQNNTIGTITLQNAPVDQKALLDDPIETNSNGGVDAITDGNTVFGSNPCVVRVTSYHHGLEPGDFALISGVSGSGSPSNIGGIPIDALNGLQEVVDVNIDEFTFKVPATIEIGGEDVASFATSDTNGGGNEVQCSYNLPYEVINCTTGAQLFGSSSLLTQVRATQAGGVTGYNEENRYVVDVPETVVLADSFYFNGAKTVANYLNEVKYRDSYHLAHSHSLLTTLSISTTNSKVSPVIDITRTNATLIRSLVDNPKPTDNIFGTKQATLLFNHNDSTDISSYTPAVDSAFEFLNGTSSHSGFVKSYNAATKKLVVEGQFVDLFRKTSTFSDSVLNDIGLYDIQATDAEAYVPETSNEGSVYAKWISRVFLFENPCDGIKVKISAVFYGNEFIDDSGITRLRNDNIKLYYRPKNIGFDGELNTVSWIPFSSDPDDETMDGLPDAVSEITPRSSEDVDPRRLDANDWQSLTWTLQDIPSKFNGLALKVVMASDNPAYAPLLDDIQIVCSE